MVVGHVVEPTSDGRSVIGIIDILGVTGIVIFSSFSKVDPVERRAWGISDSVVSSSIRFTVISNESSFKVFVGGGPWLSTGWSWRDKFPSNFVEWAGTDVLIDSSVGEAIDDDLLPFFI